jgi:very-short-patch-repair endonuclease
MRGAATRALREDRGMSPFPPRPLPDDLSGRVFTRIEALRAGASPDRLRAHDLDRRVWGVRAPVGAADDLRERCRMFSARLPPHAFVSHSTAARLLGAPLPGRFERMTRIHVTVEAPARAPHAAGLIGHSRIIAPRDIVVEAHGLRHSSPERTVCEMAGVLSLGDLVALIDFVASSRSPLTTLPALVERLRVGDRITRSRKLPVAIRLADPRSESRPESLLRVILMTSGLYGWSPNLEVVDADTGQGYRLDLAHPESRVALEYQGDYHRSQQQWRRDMTRRARLEAQGWRIMEINADDLHDRVELAARIRRFMRLT